VKRFADFVGVEERLKMLTLLTLVDLSAVSPDTLTAWREDLLWRLYVDTYNELTLGYGDARIAQSEGDLKALFGDRPTDLSKAEIEEFLKGLPRRYLRQFDREAVYRHVRLSRHTGPEVVHTTLERKGPAWELTVVTRDKPFLFSNVCGTLSSFGVDILRGNAITTPDGLVLDVFQFTDAERFLELNEDGPQRIVEVLEEAVSGWLDISERLRGRRNGLLHRCHAHHFPPVVHADGISSPRYTILDIVAANEIGLLHRISRVISSHQCNVELVLISTLGAKAIDVFHLSADGAKLTAEAQAALAASLQAELEQG